MGKKQKSLRTVLLDKVKEALSSVFPVATIVLLLCMTPLVKVSGQELLTFLLSTLFLISGIALFNLGADLAMSPMGEHIGVGLSKSKKLLVLLGVSFVMGVFITIAEPDLSVLASQVSNVIDSTILTVTIGIGIGIDCFFLWNSTGHDFKDESAKFVPNILRIGLHACGACHIPDLRNHWIHADRFTTVGIKKFSNKHCRTGTAS